MRYLSVCSGIEAATVAWHPLGWTPVAFAEIEKFPSAVLAHHYPSVPNWGDMTKFKEWPDACVCGQLGQGGAVTYPSVATTAPCAADNEEHGGVRDRERCGADCDRAGGERAVKGATCEHCGGTTIDLLVGGTPCQSFSVAGLRKGLADPRGNLALTYLALADKYRPEWLVWENVPGVLSSGGGRDFGSFVGGLGELGYGWAYRVLDAQYFGLAQRRKRVFVVASLRGWQRAAAVLFDGASLRGDSAPRREAGQGATPILEAGARTGRSTDDVRAGSGIGDPGDPMFTLQAGKHHGVLPDVANTLGGASQSGGFRTTDLDNQGAFIPEVVGTLSDGAHMGGGLTGKTPTQAASLPSVALCLNAGAMGRIDAESETLIPIGGAFDDVAHSLRANGCDASEDGTGRGTPLVPVAIRTAQTSANGHGLAEDIAHTLDQVQGQAVAFDARQSNVNQYGEKTGPLDTHGYSMAVRQSMQVRRLTPRECERLQGFPDDYTLIPYRGKLAADGPRYKALGNSMAVPVMRWIGKRIQMVNEISG